MSATGTHSTRPSPRARMIAERQRRDPLWRVIHLLGSLKLALVLLATIAIAIAVATFMEAGFDAGVARAWIYKAPWFIAWLGVLCINLFAVTLTRWPWQRKHTGFIITHYGIILLLIGAVIGSKFGFEGNVTLRTDGQPQRRIVTDRSCLQVESPADSYLYLMPLDTRFLHVSAASPAFLPVPGTALRIGIDAVAAHLAPRPRLVPSSGKAAGSCLLLEFSSGMMGRSLRVGLGTGEGASRTNEFFGRATITLHPDATDFPLHDPSLTIDGGKPKPWLDLAPAGWNRAVKDSGSVAYRIGKGGSTLSSGILHRGDSIPLGWADWNMMLTDCGPDVAVMSSPAPVEGKNAEGVPGFHAFLTGSRAGKEERGPSAWVTSGEVVPLSFGEDIVRLGYGLELKPIPFSVALTDFQVPRDEGTETPSDFRASVLFRDTATGEERSGLIRMNHPASWPGGLLANSTGFNYKFSQAEWNPKDLKETTLQVLYDPGWMPKWLGSLAICLGIATMFYIRPRS